MDRTQKLNFGLAASNILVWVLLALFIVLAIITGYLTYTNVREMVASGHNFLPGSPQLVDKPTLTPGLPGDQATAMPTLAPSLGPVPKPWDGAARVTVLIVGLDYRDWEQGEGPPRSDTMILLTVDPLTGSAGMLNIPRDLWVNIPGGFKSGKINTAYALGEAFQYPGGGPGLAIDTVEQFLGVPINYYAQIDFSAFEKFIDEIGGIEIDVPAEIKVDPIGPHNTVELEPGKQMLDGPTALAYARARNSEGGDFDHGNRQQQVIMAIRHRILSLDLLPTLMAKAPILYEELASGIHTNMTLDEAFSLAWLAKDIPLESVRRGIISPPDQVILTKSPDGKLDVLKPITNKIRLLRDEIFASSVPLSEIAATSTLDELMQMEGARITILNGSGSGGLASRTQEYLVSLGANVISTGDADQIYSSTTFNDYTGNPFTLRFCIDWMELTSPQIRSQFDPTSQTDVVIILGADWANNNTLP
ncbi:MAG: LytR family transcriptional regulator [Chloroflexota bacterium]|nr:MAG: LytR family transcriptional regulator [Chloroflexota bacterium]